VVQLFHAKHFPDLRCLGAMLEAAISGISFRKKHSGESMVMWMFFFAVRLHDLEIRSHLSKTGLKGSIPSVVCNRPNHRVNVLNTFG
jgi:hypothetical protein